MTAYIPRTDNAGPVGSAGANVLRARAFRKCPNGTTGGRFSGPGIPGCPGTRGFGGLIAFTKRADFHSNAAVGSARRRSAGLAGDIAGDIERERVAGYGGGLLPLRSRIYAQYRR